MMTSFINDHIVILPIITPLLFALLSAFFSKNKASWTFCVIGGLLTLIFTSILMINIDSELRYYFGNFPPPYGIEYKATNLSAFFVFFISLMFFLTVPYGEKILKKEVPASKMGNLYAVAQLGLAGFNGIILSNDIFNIYVFLEISSIATYGLIAMGKNKMATKAAFEYLILGTIGATFFLIGIAFLYAISGTLNFDTIRESASLTDNHRLLIDGFIFISLGIFLKLAIFPLHHWLVRSYTYAPNIISAFLSATATKISLFLLIRVIYEIFGENMIFDNLYFQKILLVVAIGNIIVGSFSALMHHNAKKILAYSSIANIGYILLALSLNSAKALEIVLISIFAHSIAKALLFSAYGVYESKFGTNNIIELRGKNTNSKLLNTAIVLGLLSLSGIPITFGFIGKVYLLDLFTDNIALFTLIISSSILTLVYCWRLLEPIIFHKNEEGKRHLRIFPANIALIILMFLIIILALFHSFFINQATISYF